MAMAFWSFYVQMHLFRLSIANILIILQKTSF